MYLSPQPLPTLAAQWRIEIQKRGRFWQWRKGSHVNRVAKYGGRFDLLSEQRKIEYERNKTKRNKRGTSQEFLGEGERIA